MDDAHNILKESQAKEEKYVSQVSTVTFGFAAWAGLVTMSLMVVIAIVFQRMRKEAWSSSASVVSDAESGASDFSSEAGCSVVDVDILNMGPNKGKGNQAFEDYCHPVAGPSVGVTVNHPELDTPINEHTLEALANLHEEEAQGNQFTKQPASSGGASQQFRHATYKGTKLNADSPGSSILR